MATASVDREPMALDALLGDRYTESAFERSFYRQDLAAVPFSLARLLANTEPAAVARPRTAEEVAALVRHAAARCLPIIPRAAATSTYWNSVPVRGGLVVDLNSLRGCLSLDEERLTVTVLPGTRWGELETWLGRRDCALRSYPTSAPSATVGGWISMEGHGVGSLKYGGLDRQVIRLEAVLPDGSLFEATAETNPPLSWFLGAEGTLGIITRVELAVRRQPAQARHYLLAFPDMISLQSAILDLTGADPLPFFMHVSTVEHQRMLRRAGFEPPADQPTLAVTLQGDGDEVAWGEALLHRAADRWGANELPTDRAVEEWDNRFMALRLKRGGPTLLGAESWLPVDKLNAYHADVTRLAHRQRVNIATYGNVVSPTAASVMSLFAADESRSISYTLALGLTNRLYDIALRHGGRPYGIGFWNTPYIRRAWSRAQSAERQARKRQIDPSNIMNPGKLYEPPAILWPPLFNAAMRMLAWLHSVTGWVS